ncbi:threonylcarbamoyl-AMP synthase [Burkholderiaceae bacterium DAT-1]|nr:threonylcarbamoyl-AMP synthase [Burkholderiaceae bacterium DAT-1]
MSQISKDIDAAVELLRAGKLVGIPTETVYGLAADAMNPDAVASIFALKGRPNDHPVIVHVAGADQLDRWAVDIPDTARKLVDAFWPGSLTLILKRAPHVPLAVTGGQDTVGIRAPAHPLTAELLRQFDGGLAAPSANQFGHVSPTTAPHVAMEFGDRLPLILDGGACSVGVESTIVGLTGDRPMLLRPGGVPVAAIESVLGMQLEHHQKAETAKVRVSGLLDSHYAPRTPLIIGDITSLQKEALVRATQGERLIILHRAPVLVPAGQVELHRMPDQPETFAHLLYATLRSFDGGRFDALLLEAPPTADAWLAVNDRLRRAASKWLAAQ